MATDPGAVNGCSSAKWNSTNGALVRADGKLNLDDSVRTGAAAGTCMKQQYGPDTDSDVLVGYMGKNMLASPLYNGNHGKSCPVNHECCTQADFGTQVDTGKKKLRRHCT